MATQGINRRGIIGAIALWSLPTVPLIAQGSVRRVAEVEISEIEWLKVRAGEDPVATDLFIGTGKEPWLGRIIGRTPDRARYVSVYVHPVAFEYAAVRKKIEDEMVEFLRADFVRFYKVEDAIVVRCDKPKSRPCEM